jgi:hypothetical protein
LDSQETRSSATGLASPDEAAITHFRQAIKSGEHWYIAMLDAMRLWKSPQENQQGNHLRYLIDDEALDWDLLAERICETADGLVPESEKNNLLLHDVPPLDITKEEFARHIGAVRYRQYLNFHYGVTVERALVLALKDEIRKERHVARYMKDKDHSEEAFLRVYGKTEEELLDQFRRERRRRRLKSISLGELKEFTYWLFKYRVRHSDKERVASDTRKALQWVQRHGSARTILYGE